MGAVCLSLAAASPASAARTVAVQPDGKILIAAKSWPNDGAVIRLQPDGSPDTGFGTEGVAVDRRFSSFLAIALGTEGRIVAAAPGGNGEGFQVAGFLSTGAPDRSFGSDGAGGDFEDRSAYASHAASPSAIVELPGGEFVVGGGIRRGEHLAQQGMAERLDADGRIVETVGELPGPPAFSGESSIGDLTALGDGSLVAAGSIYAFPGTSGTSYFTPVLARFVPGSGAPYDASYASGEGLVKAWPNSTEGAARAIAPNGDDLVTVGTAGHSILVSRFDREGEPDPGFGEGGFARIPVVGPSGSDGSTEGVAVAATPDGRIVVAATTTKWGTYYTDKYFGRQCGGCDEMLVARLLPDGDLDHSFGEGGLLRVMKPQKEGPATTLRAAAEEVIALPGGKILVKGTDAQTGTTLLARLDEGGTLDPSFGEEGLVTLPEPCREGKPAVLREMRCRPSARVRLRLSGLESGTPTLRLRVGVNVPWSEIQNVELQLPKQLQAPGFGGPGKVLIERSGGGSEPRRTREGGIEVLDGNVIFRGLRLPTLMRARLSNGALRTVGREAGGRPLVFRVTVNFTSYKLKMGRQTVTVRVRG